MGLSWRDSIATLLVTAAALAARESNNGALGEPKASLSGETVTVMAPSFAVQTEPVAPNSRLMCRQFGSLCRRA